MHSTPKWIQKEMAQREKTQNITRKNMGYNFLQFNCLYLSFKDLSRVKASFKSVPPQLYFEIAGLASAKKWRKIQGIVGEEPF